MRSFILLLMLCFAISSPQLHAEPGKPVAVRWWGQAMVSIETYWNFKIVIDPYMLNRGDKDPDLLADLVLITHHHSVPNGPDIAQGDSIVVNGLDESGKPAGIYHMLDRFPNQPKADWSSARLKIARSPNAIRVTSIPAWQDNAEVSQRSAVVMLLIEVDGVRIVHCSDIGQKRFTNEQLNAMGKVDVLIIPVGGTHAVDGPRAAALVQQVKPRIVVPIYYMSPTLNSDLANGISSFLNAIDSDYERFQPVGNTLAVSKSEDKLDSLALRVVLLNYQPWQMPEELVELFVKKEKASIAIEKVFAPLSVEQMNFRPSNGTHTPRWNAEHMMGRELGFFTEIYAQLHSAIEKIDLNPAQMPPDYEAAHPDWTGAEEARQIERVSAMTRRFSYLLADLPLDEQAPGSRWTLRKLLEQMARHYGEHTANVKLKFQLPDWPQK